MSIANPYGTSWMQSYGYDAAGNLQARTNAAAVRTFSLESLNQISSITRSGPYDPVIGVTTTAASNVTVNGLGATLYSDNTFVEYEILTNGLNTFTAIAMDALGRKDTNSVTVNLPVTVNFTYDANGNLRTDDYRTFSYDKEDRLISVFATNPWKSESVYDGTNRRRVRKDYTWRNNGWLLTNETRYVYDGNIVIQERNEHNIPVTTYTRELDLSGDSPSGLKGAGGIGGLLARMDHSEHVMGLASAHAYYHADGNGNVTMLLNDKQHPAAMYRYDPFGNTLAKAGPPADANMMRFSSKETHASSGLYYYGYRFYSPNLQRWLNRDPLGDIGSQVLVTGGRLRRSPIVELSAEGASLYGYVRNRPTGLIDRYGLVSLPPGWGGPGRPYDPSLNPFGGPIQWPWSDPNYNKAKEWLKKCHPELQCPTVLIPLPGDRGGQSLIFFSLIDFQPGKGVDGYIDDLAHEGMHCRSGPAWGAAHYAIYEHADLIAREYWKDPEGKNCKCSGQHPGAEPPGRPPPFTNWGGF